MSSNGICLVDSTKFTDVDTSTIKFAISKGLVNVVDIKGIAFYELTSTGFWSLVDHRII